MSLSKSLLIKKPWVSERATDLASLHKYIFLVERSAKSREIREAIENIYKVKVVKVNIVNLRTNDKNLKKAIVTLKEGDKIDVIPH